MAQHDSIADYSKDRSQSEQVQQLESAIAELEATLDKERDKRREERFYYIALLVMLLNVIFFSFMPTTGGPIALLVIQLLLLISLARKMGLEEMEKMIDRVLGSLSRGKRGDG